jgi:hypothetical protein
LRRVHALWKKRTTSAAVLDEGKEREKERLEERGRRERRESKQEGENRCLFFFVFFFLKFDFPLKKFLLLPELVELRREENELFLALSKALTFSHTHHMRAAALLSPSSAARMW